MYHLIKIQPKTKTLIRRNVAWEIEEKYDRQQNIQARIDTNIDGSVQNFDQNLNTVFTQRL